MNINDLYNDVRITLDKDVSKNEFIGCLNTVIRRLNSEAEKPIELIKITGDFGDLIGEITEYIVDMDTEIGDGSRFINGIEWDGVGLAITLPKDYTKVLSVFYDDTKMQPISYDLLKVEMSTDYYTTIGNTIFFNTDIESATAEIKVRAKRNYPIYVSGEYEGLPENAYSLLLNGICFMLSARPKYKTEIGIALYKGLFEQGLEAYNKQVLIQDLKSINETPFYTY